MRKIISAAVCMVVFAAALHAVPARPYPVRVQQPDGTYITVQKHGDEFHHWSTSRGKTVKKGNDGFWRESFYFAPSPASVLRAKSARKHRAMKLAGQVTTGTRNFCVILVEFSDVKFTISNPVQAFTDLLNKEGYSENGGTGSAKDYFRENSRGTFTPVFDVYGPVAVDGTMASYGRNNGNGDDVDPAGCFYDALVKAKDQVDFSKYDSDGDGEVDMVLFYYAGYNEAEAPEGVNENTIWPHEWSLQEGTGRRRSELTFGGKVVDTYACASEFRGYSGGVMCGIATACHEFGHAIGLPDMYDTDYDKNEYASNPDVFSIMAAGSYNNDGCSPPYLSAVERQMLGWMGAPVEITAAGAKTLAGIQDNAAMSVPSGNDGEFFVLEVRNGQGWDKYIQDLGYDYYNGGYVFGTTAKGLMVYHLDRSDNKVHGSYTARSLWEDWESTNAINAYGNHPCFYPFEAVEGAIDDYSYSKVPYGGTSSVTSVSAMELVSWKERSLGFGLENISLSGTSVSFDVTFDSGRKVAGVISDGKGNAIAGATVSLSEPAAGTSGAKSPVKKKALKALRSHTLEKALSEGYTTVTDKDGFFCFTLSDDTPSDLILTVSCDGYDNMQQAVSLESGIIVKKLDLTKSSEEVLELRKYTELSWDALGDDVNKGNYMAGVEFTASELAAYAGKKFTSMSVHFFGSSADRVDLFIDMGGKRVLTKNITSSVDWDALAYGELLTVDISSDNIVIEAGKDVIFGYALKNVRDDEYDGTYVVSIDEPENYVEGGGLFLDKYSASYVPESEWYLCGYTEGGKDYLCNVIASATLGEAGGEGPVDPPIGPVDPGEGEGFPFYTISGNVDGIYAAGESVKLTLVKGNAPEEPKSVVWKVGGLIKTGESWSGILAVGTYKITATLIFQDGSIEELTRTIKVAEQ